MRRAVEWREVERIVTKGLLCGITDGHVVATWDSRRVMDSNSRTFKRIVNDWFDAWAKPDGVIDHMSIHWYDAGAKPNRIVDHIA